ncbi:MAG: hypothetical protein K1X94_13010 [Sandaracinaceae bacterium]|nr:hypothetical protein [Sandaracinaceae bacterium]
MKIAPPEASSDLERAQALSRSLASVRTGSSAGDVTAPREPYVRLSMRRATALAPLEVGARWPRIVRWLRESTFATAVFAVDRKGLVIASVGLEDDEAMRIGGRVALAFDQSALVDEVRSLVIDWAGETLTALEVRDADDVPVLLGVIGHPEPVPRAKVVAAIASALSVPA